MTQIVLKRIITIQFNLSSPWFFTHFTSDIVFTQVIFELSIIKLQLLTTFYDICWRNHKTNYDIYCREEKKRSTQIFQEKSGDDERSSNIGIIVVLLLVVVLLVVVV